MYCGFFVSEKKNLGCIDVFFVLSQKSSTAAPLHHLSLASLLATESRNPCPCLDKTSYKYNFDLVSHAALVIWLSRPPRRCLHKRNLTSRCPTLMRLHVRHSPCYIYNTVLTFTCLATRHLRRSHLVMFDVFMLTAISVTHAYVVPSPFHFI